MVPFNAQPFLPQGEGVPESMSKPLALRDTPAQGYGAGLG